MTGCFGGDVSPRQTWDALSATPGAVLLDVRTKAEWTYVGGPDLSALERPVVKVEWQVFPSMEKNPRFLDEFAANGITAEQPLYILCRSGVRSRAAALALAERGYTTYNIIDGFEGQIDAAGHRGHGGWRAAGLPWRQS